jgi:5-methylcytosine-specific restriction enzyme A
MPYRPLRPCGHPERCPRLTDHRSGRCEQHRPQPWQHRKPPAQRGIDAEHFRMRRRVLKEEPACRHCGAPATIADHIRPRATGGGNERENYQGLCAPCSDRKSLAEATAGRRRRA